MLPRSVSLAVKYSNPLAVLLGTTIGMVVADSFGIILGIILGKRLPDAVIRLVSAGVFIFFGLMGASAVLSTWLPLAGSAAAVFTLAVAALGAAHALIIQRRGIEGGRAPATFAQQLVTRLSQSLFALLLLVAWLASLGLARPLAAVDHWIAFVLLAGLGWRRIGQHRIEIAGGLVLIGIALKTLIEHLA